MIVYKIANRQDGFSFKYTILNGVQVVGGSNPLAPTNKIKGLRQYAVTLCSFDWPWLMVWLTNFPVRKGVDTVGSDEENNQEEKVVITD